MNIYCGPIFRASTVAEYIAAVRARQAQGTQNSGTQNSGVRASRAGRRSTEVSAHVFDGLFKAVKNPAGTLQTAKKAFQQIPGVVKSGAAALNSIPLPSMVVAGNSLLALGSVALVGRTVCLVGECQRLIFETDIELQSWQLPTELEHFLGLSVRL